MMDNTQEKKKPFALPDVGNFDAGKFAPLYGLPNPNSSRNSEPDYIPYNKRGRDFYGRLAYNTGVLWLGGYVAGGSYGFVTGWKNAANPNMKIRFNSVMNAFSKYGTSAGNGLGIIGFTHTSSVWVADQLDLENLTGLEASTPVFAGLVTGAVVGLSRGRSVRALGLGGVIGIAASTAYWYGGTYLNDKVMNKSGKF